MLVIPTVVYQATQSGLFVMILSGGEGLPATAPGERTRVSDDKGFPSAGEVVRRVKRRRLVSRRSDPRLAILTSALRCASVQEKNAPIALSRH